MKVGEYLESTSIYSVVPCRKDHVAQPDLSPGVQTGGEALAAPAALSLGALSNVRPCSEAQCGPADKEKTPSSNRHWTTKSRSLAYVLCMQLRLGQGRSASQ